MLKKIEDTIYNIGELLCIVFMFLMVVIVCITVFGRFVLNKTPAWGDETAIACMIWFGLISSSLAERDDRHIRITIFEKVYPKPLLRVFRVINYLLKLFFGAVICFNSIRLVIFNRNVFMTGARISQSFVCASGVVMGALMIIFLLFRWKKEILNK